MRPKITVFAAIPRASDTAAIKLTAGFFTSIRKPNAMSCHSVDMTGFSLELRVLPIDAIRRLKVPKNFNAEGFADLQLAIAGTQPGTSLYRYPYSYGSGDL